MLCLWSPSGGPLARLRWLSGVKYAFHISVRLRRFSGASLLSVSVDSETGSFLPVLEFFGVFFVSFVRYEIASFLPVIHEKRVNPSKKTRKPFLNYRRKTVDFVTRKTEEKNPRKILVQEDNWRFRNALFAVFDVR